ncbi:hypothetical protein ACWIUD_03215 [Helicobacter sp. 23-1044]
MLTIKIDEKVVCAEFESIFDMRKKYNLYKIALICLDTCVDSANWGGGRIRMQNLR